MSDLHTYKVMQGGDADGKPPRPSPPAFGWPAAVISILLLLLGAVILYPVFAPAKGDRGQNTTLSCLKHLALANVMYSVDYNDRLPPAEKWMDAVEPYSYVPLYDPSVKDSKDDEYGFAFFEPVSCVDTRAVRDPDKVPLVFQSVLMARNAHSDLSTLPHIPRNGKLNYVAFVTGYASAKGFPPTWPEHPITVVIDPSLAKETR